MVERHIIDFLSLKGVMCGLAFYREQAMESVHHDCKLFWAKYKVDIDHPEFCSKLKAAVSAYCARHL